MMIRQHRAALGQPSMSAWSVRAACAAMAATAGLALAAGAAGPAPARLPAGARTSAGRPAMGGLPRYFADILQWGASAGSPLEVRKSATGKLVARDNHVLATGVTAIAGGRAFVIAEPIGNSCATRLYRIKLSDQGQPGRPSPLHIRKLHGAVVSLAASANGHLVGLAIGGCVKGSRGYLAVVHVSGGRIRRWGELNVGGVTAGNVGLNGPLSMSANGRLLTFPAVKLSATSKITEQDVRVLPVNARPGTVAQRSRIVHGSRYPPCWPLLVSAALSPGSGTLYSCAALGRAGRAVRISAYRTTTGRQRSTPARLIATGSGQPVAGHCPMALDRRGRYLLVPYAIRYPKAPAALSFLRVALMAVRDDRIVILKIRLPGGSGMNPVAGMSIAW